MSTGGCSQTQYDTILLKFDNDVDVTMALCNSIGPDAIAANLVPGVNSLWLILCGALVFLMHAGFAMLCAGAIRSKNAMNILLQTILDACVSALSFYIIGFAFAYGEGNDPNKFIGNAMFALARYTDSFTGNGMGRWTDFFFQWAFAATATTIPAGAVAERLNFNCYLGYSAFISAWVYPVVVHWVWCRQGWLTYAAGPAPAAPGRGGLSSDFLFESGMIDFAGSGVVHMVGGMAGMVGAILVGPRLGRFDASGKPVDMPGHSAVLVVLGTMILWFGWYGFNPGSSLIIDNPASANVAARAAVTTTLSGAAAGISSLILGFFRHRSWDLCGLCNGVLVGFVSITAGAHVLEPWAAIIAGAVGAMIFELVCWLFLNMWKIDDPLSAAPMHGFGGMWGVFVVGLLAKQEYVIEAYARPSAPYHYGLFYGGGGRLLAAQVIGILVIGAWTVTNMGIFFGIFKFFGILRISMEEEQLGLDASKHGGSAYNNLHAALSDSALRTDAKTHSFVRVAANTTHRDNGEAVAEGAMQTSMVNTTGWRKVDKVPAVSV